MSGKPIHRRNGGKRNRREGSNDIGGRDSSFEKLKDLLDGNPRTPNPQLALEYLGRLLKVITQCRGNVTKFHICGGYYEPGWVPSTRYPQLRSCLL